MKRLAFLKIKSAFVLSKEEERDLHKKIGRVMLKNYLEIRGVLDEINNV